MNRPQYKHGHLTPLKFTIGCYRTSATNGGAESLPDRVYPMSIRHLLEDDELWRFQRRWLGLMGGGYWEQSLVTCCGFGGDVMGQVGGFCE